MASKHNNRYPKPGGKLREIISKNATFSAKKKTASDIICNPFEIFFQAIPHVCLILDSHGRVKATNRVAASLLGKASEELIGLRPENLFPETLSSLFPMAWSEKKPLSWKAKIGGKILECSLLFLPRISPRASASAAIFLADVTEYKERQMETSRQLEQQRFLLELANSLLNCPLEKTQDIIRNSLAALGNHAGADRASIILEKMSGYYATMIAEWRMDSSPSLQEALQDFNPLSFPSWYEHCHQGRTIRVSKLAEL